MLVIELNKLNLLLGFVKAKDDVEISLPRLGCEKSHVITPRDKCNRRLDYWLHGIRSKVGRNITKGNLRNKRSHCCSVNLNRKLTYKGRMKQWWQTKS